MKFDELKHAVVTLAAATTPSRVRWICCLKVASISPDTQVATDCLRRCFLLNRRMTATPPRPTAEPTLDPATDSPLLPAAHTAIHARAHQRYWRFNLILIAVLCVVGGTVSFVLPMFAPSLAQIYFGGWSLPYYMGAQGAILIYVMLICLYVLLMQRADRILQQALQQPAAAVVKQAPGPRA
jgi:putative solute:sodium symporter small subunit